MKFIFSCSIISVFLISCSSVEVARQTGKAIKSIEQTFLENKQEIKKEAKKIDKQKKYSSIQLIGKNKDQIILLLWAPSFIRENGEVYMIRFDKKDCRTYTFLNKEKTPPIVEYFELRNINGDLLTRKNRIQDCLSEIS